MATKNLGKVAFVFKGGYSDLTSYDKYDVVFDGESSFISIIENNLGNSLSDTGAWKYLCRGSYATLGVHIDNVSNPHSVTKSQVGLSNADNTSDLNKPISTATQTALNAKVNNTRNIIAGAGITGGGTLDSDRTLNVASANDGITVNDDNIQLNTIDNVTTTSITKPLSANQGKVLNDNINVHKDNIDNPHNVTKAQVGLSSVDNTTDLDKPVSTAQQTALNLKVDKAKQVISGSGLTGGGDLSADRTINVGATDDSVIIGADGIKVDTQNTLTSTSITKPLAANQGKVLNESLVQLGADLGDNIEPALAEIINHQNGRIKALEDLVKNMLFKAGQFDTIDIVKQLNIWGGTNLVIVGTEAPSIVPDFIGQFYVNTTGGVCYQAKGTSATSDWKQISN